MRGGIQKPWVSRRETPIFRGPRDRSESGTTCGRRLSEPLTSWKGEQRSSKFPPNGIWLDVPEAAAALGVRHVFSVYRAIWDGRLGAIQRGRDIRVSLAAIKAYLKEEASRPGRKGRQRLRE